MRKLYLFLLACSILVLDTHAQNENNVWAFGTNAGLDFGNGDPTAVLTNISGFGEANASVCDAGGQLLFYTEGSYVWNKNGVIMPNGAALTSIPNQNTVSPTTSTGQGALIVPIPGTPDKYYIFSLTSSEFGQNGGRLYYSIVDMNLNGGLGDIVPAQKGILLDINITEKLIATTGEHCNIWLLTSAALQPIFKAFEITNQGININPVISNVGTGNSVSGTFGTMTISPNRKKIAATQFFTNCASIYDFNPATGMVSNPLVLMTGVDNAYGASFSADNSKLYISRHQQSQLLQYDLSSGIPATIIASRINLGFCGFSQLKLGPNGKIYFQGGAGGLSVINKPNLAGIACDVQYNVVPLLAGSGFYAGLPNQVPVMRHDSASTSSTINAGCFVTDVSLHAGSNTGWGYTWNMGLSGSACIVNTPGIYWVSYWTEPCQLNTDSFILNYPNGMLPQLEIESSCRNSSNGKAKAHTYTGDTTGYHYIWLSSANDTLSTSDTLYNQPSGNYRVHISTMNCDTVLAFVIPEEYHAISFESPSIVCSNDVVTFQNTSDNYYTRFQWYFGDNNGATISNPLHTYTNAGIYEVTLVGNGEHCRDTVSKNIIVDPLVPGTFHSNPNEICIGDKINFTLHADSTSILLNWRFGDETDVSGPPVTETQHAYDRIGIMPVTLTTQFRACPNAVYTDTVIVYELPKVDLGSDTFLCLNAGAITLSNKQPLSGTYRCQWNTGDTSRTLKVVHPGTYSLTVKNEPLGCSTTEAVVVNKDCYIDIPNVFSPNGDGINDYFFPRQMLSRGLVAFHMQILNRWGQLIFESKNVEGRGWDGYFNNSPQPEGVYIYRISADLKNGKRENYQGNVTLIR